ncbi:Cupredoxin [Irpex rosettiformis]|uniref:Cupredoxin n=1 Tax=Irpex rosettiformis TaxID=378272 RepID=A0ACB8TWP5_9APHY|nr:Cupredoxin [Irpex rosettiformis]
MQFLTLLPAILAAGSAFAANIQVVVGGNSTLTFAPNSITAQAGDTIDFVFVAGNHSVTQSTFANPCQSNGGLDSGFQPIAQGATSAMQFSVNVTDATTPLWFFCRQSAPKNHCQNGMVFAVNPTADKSFSAFQTAAMNGAAAANSTSASSAASGSASATESNSAAATGGSSASISSSAAVSSGSAASQTSSGSPAAATTNAAGSLKVGMTSSLLLAGLAASLML